MAGEVRIKITGDSAEHVAQIQKTNDAHRETHGILGKQVEVHEKVLHGLSRSLLKAIAIKDVVEGITEGFKKASERAEELSKKSGEGAVKLGGSLATLGFKGEALGGQLESIERLRGPTSLQDREQFAASLARIQEERKKNFLPEISQQQASQALSAYATGGSLAYGEGGSELTRLFSDPRYGYSPNVAAEAARIREERLGPGGMAALPERILSEGDITDAARNSQVESQDIAAAKGGMGRRAKSAIEAARVAHPVLSGLLDYADRFTGGAGSLYWQALEEGRQEKMVEDMQKQVERRTLHNDSKQAAP